MVKKFIENTTKHYLVCLRKISIFLKKLIGCVVVVCFYGNLYQWTLGNAHGPNHSKCRHLHIGDIILIFIIRNKGELLVASSPLFLLEKKKKGGEMVRKKKKEGGKRQERRKK